MVQISTSRTRPRAHGRREAKRAEILRRAADAFREKGFHAAAMRDIAATLGMTPGNLYYYFKSKDDLLYFCQKQALTRLLFGARKILSDDLPPAIRLRELLQAHVICLLEETGGSAANLEFRALPTAQRHEIAAKRDEYERIVRGVVSEGIKDKSFRRVNAKLATLSLLGAVNSVVVWWRPDGPKEPGEIAQAYADTLVGGLLP